VFELDNIVYFCNLFYYTMNEFSTNIYNQIIQKVPNLEGLNKQETELLEFHIENDYKAAFGDLFIQTDEENKIWIKASHPFTTYEVDSVEELSYIIGGLLFNHLFWVVSYEDEDWDDTFLILKDQEIKMEEGISYKILSWNGNDDKVINSAESLIQ